MRAQTISADRGPDDREVPSKRPLQSLSSPKPPTGKSPPVRSDEFKKNEDQIRALKEKARADLSDAELLLESGTAESTINRAYYAVFQAARAALQTEGESPDTHSGVIRRFGYHFVRTGRVSDEVGAILTSARSMRGEADYDAFSDLSREEAAGLVEKARRFIEAVEKQILSGR